jgi:hypothetical protein
MGIIIGGNAFDAVDFNPSGEAASPTAVTRGLVLWLDAGNNSSYANTANYYDCGYGCQYYSSNPGCTNCNTRWKDMSGNGRDAALLGSTTVSYNIGGGSMYFSGSPDYAGVIGSLGSFSTFTVEIWFKSDSVSNYRNPIDCNWLVFNGGASGYSNIGPRLEQDSNGTLGWVIGDAAGNYTGLNVVPSGLNSALTHCAVITKTGASSFLSYYNGANVTSTTFSNWAGSMGSVNIGRGFSTSPERWFIGGVPIVRIYNVALSATEILQNYNNGRTRFGI